MKKLTKKDYINKAKSFNKFCDLYKDCSLEELKELFKDARASKKEAIIALTAEKLKIQQNGEEE